MKTIFKWVFLIGLLVAVIAALVNFSAVWFTSLLLLAAVLVGIFFFDLEDLAHICIRFLALFAVAGSLDKFIGVGSFLTKIFTAAVEFIGPAVLAALVMYFVNNYVLGKN